MCELRQSQSQQTSAQPPANKFDGFNFACRQSGPGVSNSVTNRRKVTLWLGRACRNAKYTTGNLRQNREIFLILPPEDERAVVGTRNQHCLVLGKLLSAREHVSAGCLVTSRRWRPISEVGEWIDPCFLRSRWLWFPCIARPSSNMHKYSISHRCYCRQAMFYSLADILYCAAILHLYTSLLCAAIRYKRQNETNCASNL